jgi:hypothetical protein
LQSERERKNLVKEFPNMRNKKRKIEDREDEGTKI